MRWRIGIDTGGTFTDFVLEEGAGHVLTATCASTPRDPPEAFVTGLMHALRREGIAPGDLGRIRSSLNRARDQAESVL